MTRWAIEKTFVSLDREHLQNVIIYPPGHSKEKHKAENKGYSYRRLLLIQEKDKTSPIYNVSRISQAGQ